MTAVFGDFLTLAGQHIRAVTCPAADLPADARPGIASGLSRLVAIMARYAADPALPGSCHPAAPQPRTAAELTALDCKAALTRAAQALTAAARPAARPRTSTKHPAETHLHAAADCLAAGHDLLKTHFPGPAAPVGSRWAPVITSVPVTTALLAELASYAMQLAPLAARLAMPSPDDTTGAEPASQALHAASSWLHLASTAITAPSKQIPPDAERLLRAIPANLPPPRRVPAGGETIAGLCAGVTSTAERLRHLVLRSGPGRWPPAATSTTWRRDALATAILGHTSELTLRTLADRARQVTPASSLASGLDQAADAIRQAWTTWQEIACTWDTLTTGTSRTVFPVAAELGDLVLWTGRLARTAPDWTPARRHASQIRRPADLAPTTDDLTTAVAAIERAASTATLIARHDSRAVRHTASEHGVYIPTRLLPAKSDSGPIYRYNHAPRPRITALITAYDTAIRASDHADAILHDLVIAADPSGVLAATARVTGQNLPAIRSEPHRSSQLPPELDILPRPTRPGELQHLLYSLKITDPALLLRATAIDDAAKNLVAEARAKTEHRASSNSTSVLSAPSHRSSPARLAHQDAPGPPIRQRPAPAYDQRACRPGSSQPAALPRAKRA